MTEDQRKKYEEAASEYSALFIPRDQDTRRGGFLAGCTFASQDTEERLNKLDAFKKYVHDRLDKIGIPANPEPERNAEHGCRIEGRLNFMEERVKQAHNEAIEKALACFPLEFHEGILYEEIQKLKL